MSLRGKEMLAAVSALAILATAGWFWWGQLMETLDLLRLAAGG